MSTSGHVGVRVLVGLMEQAVVRVRLGIPAVLAIIFTVWLCGVGARWLMPATAVVFIVLYIAYAVVSIRALKRLDARRASAMIYATALLDPLVLTLVLASIGHAASVLVAAIFVAFHLFVVLGFGIRLGIKPMAVCHASSVAGYALVAWLSPDWPVAAAETLALGTILLIVPWYTTTLIAQLRTARERAERESLEKSRLLTTVTHELRVPLTGIVASSQLLQDSGNADDTRGYADMIIKLSAELNAQIDNLLDYARCQSDGLAPTPVPANPVRLLDEMTGRLRPSATVKGVDLHVSLDARADRLFLFDPRLLNSVLANLAGNAIKFTDHGHIVVDMHVLDDGDDAATLRLQVIDTGPGIPLALQSRIFEPFFQVAGSAAARRGGTGLGTTIAQAIVRALGGELHLMSTLGIGSRFWFDVTLAKTEIAPADADGRPSGHPAGRSILLVDDDPTNVRLIAAMLEGDGHQVRTASSGLQALEQLAKPPLDVVILDFHLGDMDGAQVLRSYRASDPEAVPVIILTADSSSRTADNVVAAGASMVLHKPVTIDTLRSALGLVLVSDPPSSRRRDGPMGDECADLTGSQPAQRSGHKAEEPVLHVVPVDFVDVSELENLRQVSRSPTFLVDMVNASIGEIERSIQRLHELIDHGDIEDVRLAAHSLKSACAYMGARRLSAMATHLMAATPSRLQRDGRRIRDDLQSATGPTVAALRAWLEQACGQVESEAG